MPKVDREWVKLEICGPIILWGTSAKLLGVVGGPDQLINKSLCVDMCGHVWARVGGGTSSCHSSKDQQLRASDVGIERTFCDHGLESMCAFCAMGLGKELLSALLWVGRRFHQCRFSGLEKYGLQSFREPQSLHPTPPPGGKSHSLVT